MILNKALLVLCVFWLYNVTSKDKKGEDSIVCGGVKISPLLTHSQRYLSPSCLQTMRVSFVSAGKNMVFPRFFHWVDTAHGTCLLYGQSLMSRSALSEEVLKVMVMFGILYVVPGRQWGDPGEFERETAGRFLGMHFLCLGFAWFCLVVFGLLKIQACVYTALCLCITSLRST